MPFNTTSTGAPYQNLVKKQVKNKFRSMLTTTYTRFGIFQKREQLLKDHKTSKKTLYWVCGYHGEQFLQKVFLSFHKTTSIILEPSLGKKLQQPVHISCINRTEFHIDIGQHFFHILSAIGKLGSINFTNFLLWPQNATTHFSVFLKKKNNEHPPSYIRDHLIQALQ